MRTLVKYLEAKREYFPRLYFLSNEEIIVIVGMMEDIATCERNLFKMFEGIAKFLILYETQFEQIQQGGIRLSASQAALFADQESRLFNKSEVKMSLAERPELSGGAADLGTVIGVLNQDGELIEFQKPVEISTCIEKTLLHVEQEMNLAVSATLLECLHSYQAEEFWDWVKLWPTQFLLLVLNVRLT